MCLNPLAALGAIWIFELTNIRIALLPALGVLTLLTGGTAALLEVLERAEYLRGDRGYDSTAVVRRLWDAYRIQLILDIQNLWKDGEETRLIMPLPRLFSWFQA